MRTKLLKLAMLVSIGVLAAACSSSGPKDAGTTVDAGNAVDGGNLDDAGLDDAGLDDAGTVDDDAGLDDDAGTIVDDAGMDADAGCTGGCDTSGCKNIAGQYTTCVDCSAAGMPNTGPFDTEVTQTCGCQVQICYLVDGGTACGNGCIKTNDAVETNLDFSGFPIGCAGPYTSATQTMVLDCPVTLGISCTATIKPGFGGSCP